MNNWMKQRSGDWKKQQQTQIIKKIEKDSCEQIKDRMRWKKEIKKDRREFRLTKAQKKIHVDKQSIGLDRE